VPLKQELLSAERRLRLPRTGESKPLDLDLREDAGRERSVLLHRLRLLDVNWGTPKTAARKAGTFHELWELRWHPELEVALIEACRFGNTLVEAAAARAAHLAAALDEVTELCALLDQAVLAELAPAIGDVLARLQAKAALSSDVRRLACALPRLAQTARYGSVRGSAGAPVQEIFDGILERVFVGLTNACVSLDDGAACAMADVLSKVHESVLLLERPGQREEWQATLAGLVENDAVVPMVRGRAARLLFDQGRIPTEHLLVLSSRALSRAVPPAHAAAFVEGLLAGSGLLLVHQRDLLAVLDDWVAGLSAPDFEAMLPLLRRTFAVFQPAERRAMGEMVRGLRGARSPRKGEDDDDLDAGRADRVMPVLAHILGVP
jgi:hypothetical protein